jgi:4-amino-4-deoxy-L-arabinose transferase-like glycosyltransferase
MRLLSDTTRRNLVLAAMAVLEGGFLVLRAQPYGAAAHGLLAVVLAATVAAWTAVALLPLPRAERALAVLLRVADSRPRAVALLMGATVAVGLLGVATQQVFSWDERSVMWAADVVASDGAHGLFARYGENGWLGPQHPPLAPLFYGAIASVFGVRLKALRVANLVLGCGAVVASFLVLERLYDRRRALLASLLLLASPLFLRIASAATNDMPLTFCFLVALLAALRLERSESDPAAVLLGALIGVGLLVKYTMVLVLPVLLALAWQHGWLPLLRRHAPAVLAIAAAFLLVWLDQAYALGILGKQQQRLERLATVVVRSPHWAMDAIFSKTPSALGPYLVPWIALGAASALRRRSSADRFVLCWVLLVFVPLLLTLPDNRYFLPAFPALAALAATALLERPRIAAHVLLLAWLLCAISVLFYTRIDLAQKAFLFH